MSFVGDRMSFVGASVSLARVSVSFVGASVSYARVSVSFVSAKMSVAGVGGKMFPLHPFFVYRSLLEAMRRVYGVSVYECCGCRRKKCFYYIHFLYVVIIFSIKKKCGVLYAKKFRRNIHFFHKKCVW